ncbi:MAG TPA: sulfotransferase domain-containing protein [Candidatus Binatia bacterium]|nr:sulfotransferase domain-containing protein [Candidatus Binatia bacterium]
MLRRTIAGHKVQVLDDDVFIVSYPRSGNTWARFLIGNLVNPDDPVTFANLEVRVPSIYTFPNRVLRRLPRILKSHDVYDPRYPRVIYIVRDPRDVAVSFYHYNLKVRRFTEEVTLDEFVDRFVAAKIWPSVNLYGTWEEHVLSWTKMREGSERFCFVRYEDLLRDPVAELKKISPLLKIAPSPKILARAVELSSADRMRSLEKTQTQWVSTKGTRKDKPFVRAAKCDNWQGTLSSTSVRKIEQAWGATMQKLGYELTTSSKIDPTDAAAVFSSQSHT